MWGTDLRVNIQPLRAAGVTGRGQRVEFETRQMGKRAPLELVNFRLVP